MDTDQLRRYASNFADVMEMRAPASEVAKYLDVHQGWFLRCAAPMQAEPIGVNGYHLILGKFGNFGFELEPSIDLELLPQAEGIYRIETLPVCPLLLASCQTPWCNPVAIICCVKSCARFRGASPGRCKKISILRRALSARPNKKLSFSFND